EEEARQIVAEELVEKVVNGRVKLLWDKKGRRNEALDCLVYAYAALRISVQRWQLDLEALARARRDEQDDDEMSLEEIAAALSGG
ncbi:phage terminase large subunit family protein, partial [Escherichia coli]|nr:phage terminase large subunit family protein [Escherichia coli]EKS8778140.1 phage terminase large subunit family protein [Escherichia coli]HBH4599910.1 phage terminase large subunit family protein [Escherichia coli]HCY3305296.1 phage terminase large subunit family protein [Escherichia coli]HCY3379048.1 phage terminase large subunit family protein [Escherichia coli]